MFLTKLVEKASFAKKPGGTSDGLKPEDLDPRLVFHYGIPSGATLLAYDTIQKILAVSTRDGRIKLFGKDGGQAILQSPDISPSKFLQFLENQPTLLNINVNNHIEVWDLESKCLSYVHDFKKEITSFTAIPYAPYLYIGDSAGNVSVVKFNQEEPTIERMRYYIPFSATHGTSQVAADTAPVYVLPQPTAENKRVLIIYANGLTLLWALQESKVIFTTGGTTAPSVSHETKKVTAATWSCPFGSKVVVGYSNGDIFLWSVPSPTSPIDQVSKQEPSAQNAPILKLNLGYKLERIPIAKLRWTYGDGKASRLYVIGSSDNPSANLLQVVLLNEHTEARTIKLGLPLPESSLDMDIIASFNTQSKQKHDSLILLGKSGHVYVYDDYLVEKYLLQSQSKSSSSLPKELVVKLPFVDSSISVGKFVTDFPHLLYSTGQDYEAVAKDILPLFPFETAQRDGSSSTSMQFRGFSNTKNLFITGHSNGAINFWDASCPLLRPSLSLTLQSENDMSLSGVPVTALYCTGDLEILVSGDQSGMLRIYKFKAETFAPDTSFLSLQAISKKSGNNLIQSVKLLKVKGSIVSIYEDHSGKHLAIGSDQGYVTLVDIEGPKVLYEKHFTSELSTGIVSVQFETCSIHGFEKNVAIIATRDSSVTALEAETGNTLSATPIRPKKPSRALFMRILDNKGSDTSERTEMSTGSSAESQSPKQQLVVLCSEKAVYVYSLSHIVQGIKKVHYKKKFHSASCCCASILGNSSGLVLLFSTGKVEIRSLPELSLLKETSVRGCRLSTVKQNQISYSSVSFSSNGDAIVVEGDQEAFFISVSAQDDVYRYLDFASQVYNKDIVVPQGSTTVLHKEKKKGIFGSIIRDITGNKEKSESHIEVEDASESIELLSTIFSVANFPSEIENEEKLPSNEDGDNLDIDDIEIEDPGEKPKGLGVMSALNKHKFTDKFQAFKGKLKHMKVKTDKAPANEPPHEEKPETVDQIKKRYGYATPGASESNAVGAAKAKLSENAKKLQGINMKTTEMQDTAQSFSSMAKQVLRFAESDKRTS